MEQSELESASCSTGPGSRSRPRELVRAAYELGLTRATGVLTIEPRGGFPELVLVRVGEALTADADSLGRQAAARLTRLSELEGARVSFHPGAVSGPERALPLARWARQLLERELELEASQALARQLEDRELCLDPARAPDPCHLDPADRRLVAALARPRRLSELAAAARVPRYRLLSFLHFLREVGALHVQVPAPVSGVRRAPVSKAVARAVRAAPRIASARPLRAAS